MNLKDLISLPTGAGPDVLAKIGKVSWLESYSTGQSQLPNNPSKLGRTSRHVPHLDEVFKKYPDDRAVRDLMSTMYSVVASGDPRSTAGTLSFCLYEALGVLAANGPKVFIAEEVHYDKASLVDLRIPVSAFQSPYPVMVIKIPLGWRRQACDVYGIDPVRAPLYTIVRWRRNGEPLNRLDSVCCINIWPGLYETITFAGTADAPDDDRTLEDVISMKMEDLSGGSYTDYDIRESRFLTEANRVALNLCLMMVRYGITRPTPVDPVKYQKHRRKKKLEHLKHGDFEAVRMVQNIRLFEERPAPTGTTRPGGYEMSPHWVRGHVRRVPGWRAYQDRGEVPPTVFIEPYLRRADRIVGDVSQSSTTYTGAEVKFS